MVWQWTMCQKLVMKDKIRIRDSVYPSDVFGLVDLFLIIVWFVSMEHHWFMFLSTYIRVTNQIKRMENYLMFVWWMLIQIYCVFFSISKKSLELSHNLFHCRTVFETVAQKSFEMRPLSHTQKFVDKSLCNAYNRDNTA